jgi:hypothetical protein
MVLDPFLTSSLGLKRLKKNISHYCLFNLAGHVYFLYLRVKTSTFKKICKTDPFLILAITAEGEIHVSLQKGLGIYQNQIYIYRDYPRPFSFVLRKEYFDCPQRDFHAVHYI